MKKVLSWISIVVGVVILISGFVIRGQDISINFIRPDLVVLGFGILGIMLIICGICTLALKVTKEIEIEQNDERNIAIGNAAKATGYEVITVMFSLAILSLAMLGYMNKVSFFILIGILFTSQIVFITKLWYLHKRM